MAVYKEIANADGSGVTGFYRLSTEKSTVEINTTGTNDSMSDYNLLLNKPSINGVALTGNKTAEDLGLQPAGQYITKVPDEYITEEELTAKGFATMNYVIEQVSSAEHFSREIVDALPLNGKVNVIYMLPKEGVNDDVYNEYLWTGLEYELIGSTAPDLTNYYVKEEIDNKLEKKVDKIDGKQLSTEDYTTEEKEKLASLFNYDDTELLNRVLECEREVDGCAALLDIINGEVIPNE